MFFLGGLFMEIEVLQSEFENSEIVIHNPATALYTQECDWHLHNALEFLYCIEGNIIVYTAENECHLNSGDIILINSRCPHKTKTQKNTFVFLLQSELIFGKESALNAILTQSANQNDMTHVFPAGSDLNREINECFEKIIREYTDRENSYETFIRSAVLNIHGILYRNDIIKNPQSLLNQKYIKKILPAINYINENYADDISLSQISQLLNFDKSHFCRIFKKALNVSFIQYLNLVRINKAAKFLLTTNKTITEISSETGFSSPAYFIKNFKIYFGCTPNFYKKVKLERTGNRPIH